MLQTATQGSCCCLAATAVLDPKLTVGTVPSLASSLLAETCHGMQCLTIHSPSQALAGLPVFLGSMGIKQLTITGLGAPAPTLAGGVQGHCHTLTSLTLGEAVRP